MISSDPTPDDIRMAHLGHAVRILFSNGGEAFPVAAAYAWLWPAIRLDQILFVTDRTRRPVAFMSYAFVTPETITRILAEDPPLLDISDWNDGSNLWICDYRGPASMMRCAGRALHERAPGHRIAFALKRNAGHRSLRVFRTPGAEPARPR